MSQCQTPATPILKKTKKAYCKTHKKVNPFALSLSTNLAIVPPPLNVIERKTHTRYEYEKEIHVFFKFSIGRSAVLNLDAILGGRPIKSLRKIEVFAQDNTTLVVHQVKETEEGTCLYVDTQDPKLVISSFKVYFD